jgi:Domain of unknown function (DUF4412)
MRQRQAIRALAGFAFASALPVLAQDLTIVSKTTADADPPETTTSYLARDHVRIAQGAGKELIVDFKAGQMTTLDRKAKTYYVTTRQDLDELAAKMKAQMDSPEMKRAREQMDKLSPEERKKVESAMGGMFAFDVEKLGTKRTIAGYKCEDWKISIGAFSKTEECLTNDLEFPAQAWEMYREFAQSLKTLMGALGPMGINFEKMQEQFKSMKGYPLASMTSVNVMGHSTTSTSEVVEVKRGAIPASAWEIPAGYTKVDNPMKKAFSGARRGRDS